MKNAIYPETIRFLRAQKNMTQEQLADLVGCKKDQVSRWERGDSSPQNRYRESLAKHLGVKWEELTQPPNREKVETKTAPGKEQLRVMVSREAKVALELVRHRYNVSQSTVLELAPLLFLIAAENSLRTRQEQLNRICKAIEEAGETGLKHAPHMSPAFGAVMASAEEDLDDEQKAINRRDIYNKTIGTYDVDDYCPFTNYIQGLAKDLSGQAVYSISPSYSGGPDYTVAMETFKELTGIEDTTPRGLEHQRFILNGLIKLQDVVAKRKTLDEKAYQEWLDEAYTEALDQNDAELNQLLDGLDFDLKLEDEKE